MPIRKRKEEIYSVAKNFSSEILGFVPFKDRELNPLVHAASGTQT